MGWERPRPERRRTLILATLSVVVLTGVAAAAWIGVRALQARAELAEAVELAEELRAAASDARVERLPGLAADIAERTSTASSLTSDPMWRSSEWVPLLGDDLAAVRTMASELDRVTTDALVPLVGIAGSVQDAFRPVDGAVDLPPLIDAQPILSDAVASIDIARDRVDRLAERDLLPPVAEARSTLADAIADASEILDPVSRAVDLLPAALGADGPRSYLVLFQNNAELRSGGGIPGALALIGTDGGRISLLDQANSAQLRPTDESVLPVPQSDVDLFGPQLGRYIQNVTATPDFTLAGRLAAEFWRTQRGSTVDGVVAVDPVALAYLLEATGPVVLPDGDTLTSANAVSKLLVEAYERFPEDEAQDAYFASAAASVFATIAAGGFDAGRLLDVLGRAADEHRVAVWSARDEEQAILADTTLAGMQATQAALGDEAYAVYFNDRTGGKMNAYLDVETTVEVLEVDDEGRATVGVRVLLASTAPPDAATSLPLRTTNGGRLGVPPGVIALNVAVYGPGGAFDAGVLRDGAAIGYRSVPVDARIANNVPVDLEPGASVELVYRFLAAEPGHHDPVVISTPLMTE